MDSRTDTTIDFKVIQNGMVEGNMQKKMFNLK